ncbi:MAG: protein kinase, partial [Gammaproteobacteria bacterium]|nr:protein kinase [Gammaproteobacteria bacterium]
MTATKANAAAYLIFAEALELAAGERPAFLTRACGGDRDLRHTVERLLAIAESASETLSFTTNGATTADRAGKVYGPFRLLSQLGSGGMGSVYEAERIDGVPQRVAVKILRESVAAADRQLFLREARIIARLEHPCIARLIDVGVDHGEGWIAIEFVHGQGIVEYCDARQLDIAARVRLLVTVADAVTVAHRA